MAVSLESAGTKMHFGGVENSVGKNKRGFGLTLDATVALLFILAVALALSAYRFSSETDTAQNAFIKLHYLSEDVLDVLNRRGILDDIGTLWVSDNQTLAENMSRHYLDLMLPPNVGYRMTFDDETIVQRMSVPEGRATAKTNSLRLLAGYMANQSVVGFVSRAFLTGIQEKTSSAYAYFGGFVGQGNITRYLEVPAGVDVQSAYLELDAGSAFNLFVNGQPCQNPHIPSGGYLEADIKEDIGSCQFAPGSNTLRIEFSGSNLSTHYLGGGYVGVTYNTSSMNESIDLDSSTFELPGIEGLINYFSAFHVPGNLTAMQVHLVFENNYTTFFKIGDVVLYNSTGSAGVQTVDLSDSYLRTRLDYSKLGKTTVPIRMSTTNISETIEQGEADVVLITDLSGSMLWRVGYSDSTAGTQRSCCPAPAYSTSILADLGSDAYGLTYADYDDDSDLDIIAGDEAGQIELFLNDGSASFISAGVIDDIGSYAKGLASADFDSDGDYDFLAGDEAGQIELFLNDGSASFTTAGVVYDVGTWAGGLEAADFDGDGDYDFVSGDEYHQIELFLNGGDGTFEYGGMIRDGPGSWVWGLTAEDYDFDGDYDLLSGDRDGVVDLYVNDGSASFTYLDEVDTIADRAYGLDSMDFDSDGDYDFVRGDTGGEVYFYVNDGSANFAYEAEIADVDNRLNDLIVEDFDSDGDLDIILAREDGTLEILDLAGFWPSWPSCMGNATTNPIFQSDTRRISLAKCLDRYFVDIITNNSGNRIALVGFNDDADEYTDLTSDYQTLVDEISDYSDSPSGGTCICCALNRAYEILNAQSSPTRKKFIVLMSDGITAYCCATDGWWWWTSCGTSGTATSGMYEDCSGGSGDCGGTQCDGAIESAIWSAQRTNDDLDVVVNTVGFGPVASCDNANYALRTIANETNGSYCASTDPKELELCYESFARDILRVSLRSQITDVVGNPTKSMLHPDSYIYYEYEPVVEELDYGEITMTYDTSRFSDNTTCTGTITIPSDVSVIDARVTSYSSEHWTDYLSIVNSRGSETVFELSDFGSDYFKLGDPFVVNIPAEYVRSGEGNLVSFRTGDSATNDTGCSVDNRGIISIKMYGSIGYADVFPRALGCNWDLEFSDGSIVSAAIPSSYGGSASCSYTSSQINVTADSMADAVFRILESLDMDDDGIIDIIFDPNQMDFDVNQIGEVRSLWGPAKLKLVLWI